MPKRLNLVGQKFGRLEVIEFAYINEHHQSMFLCKCDCGNEKIIRGDSLKTGNTKRCGCLRTKHGMRKTRFYNIWQNMKQRCLSKNDKRYKNYGGRGITVCKRWLKFENFRDDMYESYLEHRKNNSYTSIDRFPDQNGNYYPKNTRWSDSKEQNNNRRDNHLISYKGKTQTLSQWAEELGINYNTLYARINTYNWLIKKAFNLRMFSKAEKMQKIKLY